MSDDPLKPQWTDAQFVLLAQMRSRLNIAGAVLDARIAKGLTQERLGKAAGTKQSRVSEIESSDGNPTIDTVDRIARVLDLEIALVPRIDERLRVVPPDAHPEDFCERCGRSNVVWFAPSSLWNKAVPEGGILCPVCFVRAAEAAGIRPAVWCVQPTDEPGVPAPLAEPCR